MKQTVSYLTQSKYYSPAFNSAIFDGPIRIYFAQHQEPAALKVYFRLQQQLKELYALAKHYFKQTGQSIFVMIYPTAEIFAHSTSDLKTDGEFFNEKLGDDFVVGACGPLKDDALERIIHQVESILHSLPRVESPRALEA